MRLTEHNKTRFRKLLRMQGVMNAEVHPIRIKYNGKQWIFRRTNQRLDERSLSLFLFQLRHIEDGLCTVIADHLQLLLERKSKKRAIAIRGFLAKW